MEDKPIKVLLIEDNPGDARLIREILLEASGAMFELEHLDLLSTGLERLAAGGIDVVLLDLLLPDSLGVDTLAKVNAQASDVPIIVLTGLDDEAFAIKAVRESAQDYLVKGQVDSNLLTRAIRYAIERKRTEEVLRQSERELTIRNRIAEIFLTVPDEEIYGEVLQTILEVMESEHGIFGYIDENGDMVCPSITRDIWEQCQMPDKDIVFPRETWSGIWGEALIEKKTFYSNDPFCVPEGHIPMLRALAAPITHQEEVIGLLQIANKATDYDEEDSRLLETIAGQIAPILHTRLQRDKRDSERKRAEAEIQRNYETQTAINSLLRLSLEDIPFEELLKRALDIILSIPWLAIESKGSIFLVEDESEVLVMKYQSGLDEPIQKTCARVPFGRCLCGQAALTQKIQFADCLDDRRDTLYEGIIPHDHYCVPILFAGKTLGVLNLYVEEGHRSAQKEEEFLATVANTLAVIIQRKQTEEALQESEGKFRSLAEQSPNMIFINRKGRIVYASKKCEEVMGYKRDELYSPDFDFFSLIAPESIELVRSTFSKHLKGEEVEPYEHALITKDGRRLETIGSTKLINYEGERAILGITTDITEWKRAEEALRESVERETQAYAQGRLEVIETILHNIGNAITSVTIGIGTIYESLANNKLTRYLNALADAVKEHQDNFADYVENNPQGQKAAPFIMALANDFMEQDERWKKTVDRVRRRAEHIADIVRTQKAFGRQNRYRKEINLRKTIDDAITILQESISKRGIEISADCDNAPKEIIIQENQFHQMLVNLVKNSIEAIDAHAGATSRAAPADAPFVKIRCYVEEDALIIEVTDSGIGIEKDKLTVVFGAGYTTKESGTGLGLHSIANFVQSNDGQICTLSDGIGKGATIRISLPLSSVSQGLPARLAPAYS